MSSNAQRDLYEEDFNELPLAATGTDGGATLRRIAAERLAAHRNRRSASSTAAPATRTEPRISETAQRVRDAVAARYRQSPSYQEVLATPSAPEPQQVPQQTQPQKTPPQTWIDEPLIPMEPVAQTPLLEEAASNDVFSDPFFTGEAPSASVDPAPLPPAFDTPAFSTFQNFEVRPYADLPSPAPLPQRAEYSVAPAHPDELQDLDEEIAFRLAPEFEQHYIDPLPIQANIIEFPRQLVAARKARPRLAEGPLRSDAPAEQHDAPEPTLFDAPLVSDSASGEFQMRIFEVDTREAEGSVAALVEEVIPEPPAPPAAEHQAPEWQHLMLDAREHKVPVSQAPAEPELDAPPVARVELRLMSALVDAACIGMAFVIFSTVTALTTSHALDGLSYPIIFAGGLALLLVLTVLYQAMFFTLGASTPGMYYAHLEFRTLAGRQPSRGLLRRRVTANLLAAAPIGAGLLWSLIDGRSLGWNDKLSGVYLQEL
jgi:hypothetical protein